MRINRSDLMNLPPSTPAAIRALVSGQVSVAEMRAMRPLPENAQKLIDDAVVRVGLDRLTVVGDVLAAGLRYNLTDFWGVTQIQWDEMAEVGYARRTMNPQARGENQLTERRARRLPVYLTWDSFELGVRTLAASQRVGAPIDTTLIEQKTRRVNEAIEDAMINGVAQNVFGDTIPGLMNAPNVNAYEYELVGGTWTAAAKTGQQILDDVLGMITLAHTAHRYGPYNLYVNTAYDVVLNKNFVTNYPTTIRERLQQIQAGGRNLVVKAADMLATNRTVLVQMTSDVVDVIAGQEPTVLSWEGASGLDLHWMVMACMVPRVKTDFGDSSGIVTGNVA